MVRENLPEVFPIHLRNASPQLRHQIWSRSARAALPPLLGFSWFYSSESGLFNGLQRIQIKIRSARARGQGPALKPLEVSGIPGRGEKPPWRLRRRLKRRTPCSRSQFMATCPLFGKTIPRVKERLTIEIDEPLGKVRVEVCGRCRCSRRSPGAQA
jgi:hypothetical protein